MVIDYRAYTFMPGKAAAFMEIFERVGLPVQNRILGPQAFLGIFRTEFGNINEIVHMWRYENAGEREARRALLYQDPEFMDYVTTVRAWITHQEVRLLIAAPFNPPIGAVA